MKTILKHEESTCIGEGLPDLYQSADRMSQSAQMHHFLWKILNIAFLVLGSISAALVMVVPATSIKWVYVALALFLAASLFFHGLSRVRRDDKIWFDCRAIAESTKTASWRFMMKIAPFEGDDDVAIRSFVETLKQIRKARPFGVQGHLARNLHSDIQPVSGLMISARHMSTKEQQDLYLKSRLRDQAVWYLEKAKFNSKKESCWFWTIIAMQILAVVYAIFQIAMEGSLLNVVPLLMTCVASGVAWSQTKNYGELARTYSLAAQELKEQEVLATHAMEENTFHSFVVAVEETISREHTMWRSRRLY